MEKPDKRIIPLIVLVLIASIIWIFTPGSSKNLYYVELVLYTLTVIYGLAVAWMSLALKYSVIRPSVSKMQDPQMFWVEVYVGGYACAVFGAWLLFDLLK